MKIERWFGIIGVIVFIYLLAKTDLKSLWRTFSEINLIWIFLALIFFALTTIVNAARWKYISNKMGIKLSLKDASIITFKSMFGENSPGKMGEIFVRATYLKKKTKTGFGKALFSTAFSRFVDIWVTAIEAVITVLILSLLFGLKSSIVFPVILLLAVIILAFALTRNERIMKVILRPIYKLIMPKNEKNFENSFNNFYTGFKSINIKVIVVSFLYDLLALLTIAIGFYFIGVSIGINFPIYLAILSEPLVTVAVSLPISFSGLGAREAVFAYLFSLIGLGLDKAIAFSLLFFVLRTLLMIPGIIMIFLEKREKKSEDI